ncbi:recombinase family protein [Mariniflexile rhizosphaerae]|uniref:recombinase family protein n=1 Tax=unclassified Mariniflexile TaxID=2643887 RepID=UPI000E3EDA37|nr:recombinase family protein [Mariniflexile sp. TRM1-10]
MEKIADLYIRVSTDEQADKGYSQRSQQELLRKYCEINKITVRHIIFEDYSAKSFNRPAWKKYLQTLRRYKHKTNLVLFLKWDRFSRNAGDAYQMISTLRRLGVEPQAIEQPLDLSIPENKMMLAFYLAAPEVENDRRSLNTFFGMRRAKKEGRCMGSAPLGYENKITENGIKYIALKEPKASQVKWIFEEVAKGVFNTNQIWKMAKEKGYVKSNSQVWGILRNPVYYGKIFIPQYKDEESQLVNGQHEALISEDLFYRVQDVLDGRGRTYRAKVVVVEDFPLRNFLICPDCDKILTGSKSKGRSKYYAYYHCRNGCKHRVNAQQVNESFEEYLKSYLPNRDVKELYTCLIMDAYNKQAITMGSNKSEILKQISDYENKLSYARELLVTKQIDSLDYRDMKEEYNQNISKLETKLTSKKSDLEDVEGLLDIGINNLLKLSESFKDKGWAENRDIIGSIFPENLTFENSSVRTKRINEITGAIYQINKKLYRNKNGTKKDFSSLSRQVTAKGFEPPTLRAEI